MEAKLDIIKTVPKIGRLTDNIIDISLKSNF